MMPWTGLGPDGPAVGSISWRCPSAARVTVEWGENHLLHFAGEKTELVLYTRKLGQELRDQIQRAHIMAGGHAVAFDSEASRRLGICLDAGIALTVHCQTRVRNAESRVQSLCSIEGLVPGRVHRIQVATVQSKGSAHENAAENQPQCNTRI